MNKSLLNVVLLDQFPGHNAQKPLIPKIEADLKLAVVNPETVLQPVIPIFKTLFKPVTPIVVAVKRKLTAAADD